MADGQFRPSPARVLYGLRRAHLAVEARKGRVLRELDVHPAHYAVLINVWGHPGVTGAELARRLGVTPQNVASLTTRLMARGLLERRPHVQHANVLELHLTAAGQDLLERADEKVDALEKEVLAMMTPDQSAALLGALGLITAGMSGDEPSARPLLCQSVVR